ncbi:SspB family protein [Camelimonas abortus]|uniref:SspB family protein n=1 Tax=Camelimonas abortus TaxID=1017184 RepID=A0ABV7LG26_9HYPH
MPKDHIRYDLLVQNALKGVVRKVLADASRDGLPGEHHFYISFRTNAPKTRLSSRLREKYPEEMTIVLQHQFWDLAVTDSQFEVGLSFGGVPERLAVPFDAVTGFYDPSVEFGLKFEVRPEPEAQAAAEEPEPRPFTPRSLRERRDVDDPAGETPAPAASAADAAASDGDARDGGDEAGPQPPQGGAQVVSLDAFRKKH